MRILRSLVAGAAVAATATALAVAPAMADPVNTHYKGVEPAPYDIVGAGSDTTQYVVDQLAYNYDASLAGKHIANSAAHPYIYSWDATPPTRPTDTTQDIKVKQGCSSELRPGSSGAGIADLAGNTLGNTKYKGKTYPCLNFARSSRYRKPASSDPNCAIKGDCWVILAQDAVSFATTNNSYLGKISLTRAQLAGIFDCSITTWGEVGVKGAHASDKIDPVIPELSSGTLSFFYTALGLGTASGEPTCGSLAGLTTGLPEENEGQSKYFYNNNNTKDGANPDIITLFSIGSYVDQAYHSRPCGKTSPKKGQNKFGCNATGVLVPRAINGVAPTEKVHGKVLINVKFPKTFTRFLYDVVPYAANPLHIPGSLQKFFAPAKDGGFFCSKKEQTTIENYGFLATKGCGLSS